MAQKPSRSKRQVLGIRIKPKEGLWIIYRLRLMGLKKKDMAERLGVCPKPLSRLSTENAVPAVSRKPCARPWATPPSRL